MDILETLSAIADGKLTLKHTLGKGEHMVGSPSTGAMVVSKRGFHTHANADGNPGVSFSAAGSELRTGPHLEIQASADNISFAGWYLNPLTFLMPQTIVNPYPLWVQKMPEAVALVKTVLG